MKKAEKKRARNKSNTGGDYVTLSVLFDKLETTSTQNRAEHQEIRMEIAKGISDLKEKTGLMNERIVKIEASPAHEKFQTTFCPNTQDIKDIYSWIEESKQVHKDIATKIGECEKKIDNFLKVIVEERKDFAAERLRQEVAGYRKMRTAIIGMVVTAIGSIAIAFVTHFIGLWG